MVSGSQSYVSSLCLSDYPSYALPSLLTETHNGSIFLCTHQGRSPGIYLTDDLSSQGRYKDFRVVLAKTSQGGYIHLAPGCMTHILVLILLLMSCQDRELLECSIVVFIFLIVEENYTTSFKF